jgi:endonuclease/exonuclease/phosphatase family metal-dependent hydrolase
MKVLMFFTLCCYSSLVFSKSLKLMTYNVANFYDTRHDEGTEDWTYLPLAIKQQIPNFQEICNRSTSSSRIQECLTLDWSKALFTKKLINISRVIKAANPDILVLQEIENKNVLNKLVTRGLKGQGYQFQVLIEGDDSRGIDVAILSRYPLQKAKHHSIIHNGQILDTRGILEAHFSVLNQDVVVFANHWPSQSNPSEERISSAKRLEQLAQNLRTDLVVAMGDFNSLDSDSPNPYLEMPSFLDLEKLARKLNPDLLPGTRYKNNLWSSIDRIFIHRDSVLKPRLSSFEIMGLSFMLENGLPRSFDVATGEGFSDHLPVVVEISL